MRILVVIGIGIAAALLFLPGIFLRRRLLMLRGGTIRLQVRVTTMVPGRGWSTGIGQFVDDELRFHRMFSFGIRPKRVLNRRGLIIDNRRGPEGPERLSMPDHWVILRCANGGPQASGGTHASGGTQLEIAMAETTVAGFLSWLEAGPPGQPGSVAPRPAINPRPVEP